MANHFNCNLKIVYLLMVIFLNDGQVDKSKRSVNRKQLNRSYRAIAKL